MSRSATLTVRLTLGGGAAGDTAGVARLTFSMPLLAAKTSARYLPTIFITARRCPFQSTLPNRASKRLCKMVLSICHTVVIRSVPLSTSLWYGTMSVCKAARPCLPLGCSQVQAVAGVGRHHQARSIKPSDCGSWGACREVPADTISGHNDQTHYRYPHHMPLAEQQSVSVVSVRYLVVRLCIVGNMPHSLLVQRNGHR
jgi:hypothetical protein